MTAAIFAGGEVMQFANGIHLPGSLESLCIIDDEKQMPVIFAEQAKQHTQGDLLHYDGLVPDATPEEFAIIGPMSRVPKCLSQVVNSCTVTAGDGHYQGPKVLPGPLTEMLADGFEKTLQFLGNFADCNHMVSHLISVCYNKSYRQMRLFLFDVFSNHKFTNRSV